jgi:purine-binding chemotaxis protein CheW
MLGALADSVQEVIELDAGQIVPPPRMGTRINTEVIRGMGKRDDHFLIILDIDRVFTGVDVRAVSPKEVPEAQA